MAPLHKPTIYGTKTCAYCKVEKQWLESKGVDYQYVDIEEYEPGAEHVQKLTGRLAVPVTVIGDNVIQGFNRPALTEALGL